MIQENYNLFPTLVRKYKNFLTIDQCNDINLNLNSLASFKEHGLLEGKSSSTFEHTGSIIKEIDYSIKSCEGIKQTLCELMDIYCDDLRIHRVNLNNSWCNIQEPGSELIKHMHFRSILSGAIYINVDENSSKLYFYNPNPYYPFYGKRVEYSQYNSDFFSLTPEIGDLVIFPSWLFHGSNNEKNKTVGRTVLSFNGSYDPEIV